MSIYYNLENGKHTHIKHDRIGCGIDRVEIDAVAVGLTRTGI